MKILLTGADGFIGRHIAFHLRSLGHEVTAQARRTSRLRAMGFAVLQADLQDPATHDPAFWRPHLQGAALVWCAGLLTGSEAAFRAVHQAAPHAALSGHAGPAVLISAVGLEAGTPFARWRRETEALFGGGVILRPGLVMAETSYGGTSALRAFAALPWVTPVVGDGRQPFNPIHAEDLARAVSAALGLPPGVHEVGGAETLTLTDLTSRLRAWLGLGPQSVVHLPLSVARSLGRVGDLLRLGPISATAVDQLAAGVLARPSPDLPRARGVTEFLSRPAGTQDLWAARLYLLKPLLRLVLAAMWLASAGLGLTARPEDFPEVAAPLWLARAGGMVDLALGLALLRDLWPRRVALAQLAVVGGYTAGLSLLAPALWADPYGGLMKNLPILVLLLVHLVLVEER